MLTCTVRATVETANPETPLHRIVFRNKEVGAEAVHRTHDRKYGDPRQFIVGIDDTKATGQLFLTDQLRVDARHQEVSFWREHFDGSYSETHCLLSLCTTQKQIYNEFFISPPQALLQILRRGV